VPHVRARLLAEPGRGRWRDETSGRTDGRKDERDVLRGGSIFLLLITP
jgi:hypothetical protein